MNLITEKRDVQERIIIILQSLGWEYIPPEDIQINRGYDIKEPFIKEVIANKLIEINDGIITNENVQDVIKKLRDIPSTFKGNQEFLHYLRGQKTIYVRNEKREKNFKLIDFENPEKNHFAFTKEFWFEDKEKKRLDIVLFINGIPICDFELKSPTIKEPIEEAFSQIKIYNETLPELFKYLQFYAISEGIKLYYGPTWKYESKTFYFWKIENGHQLETSIKTFFDKKEILKTLQTYIVFLTIDEEVQKYILKQHQRRTVAKLIDRILNQDKNKALIWHTQGSYKSLTMIVVADELRKIERLNNPTIIVVVDRLELEQQIEQNFRSYGYPNIEKAKSKKHLKELLRNNYKGLIITTIHKFENIQKNINTNQNIIVLIDEAHRSQEGNLANYMRGALPNAFFFGFTGTPVDRTHQGRGTFIAFAYPPNELYLDKYTIDESIQDGTTLPLYYTITQTDLHLDKKTLEEEFYRVVEQEGIYSIEGMNKIIEKAEKLKAVLKAQDRIDKIAQHIAEHYQKFVEPLGFKAFIVAVDREACALYKEAIDKYLPSEYTKVVYSENSKDNEFLKKYYLTQEMEITIRKDFKSPEKLPKILIVTEKLLTGYDAPILYAMYLDKPLKDHTLLQAIARVNRPYNKKTCGLIVDYIGIFDNLQRALSFNPEDIKGVLIDFERLKDRFKELMMQIQEFLKEIPLDSENKIDEIIKFFFEEEKRKEFIKLFKQIQEIYEILSPEEFLRDYIENYKLLLQINMIINNFYYSREKRKIQRDLLKKTEELIKQNIELIKIIDKLPYYEINENIANIIKSDNLDGRVKVMSLYNSIREYIEHNKEKEPYLISIVEKVEEIIQKLKDRQKTVETTIEDLLNIVKEIDQSKKEQNQSDLNKEEFSYFWVLKNLPIENPRNLSQEIFNLFEQKKDWYYNEKLEKELRIELYKKILLNQSKDKDHYIIGEKENLYGEKSKDIVNKLLEINKAINIGFYEQ
jgi:type I restriction enzyme R subunit